jgi:hypothetical protein
VTLALVVLAAVIGAVIGWREASKVHRMAVEFEAKKVVQLEEKLRAALMEKSLQHAAATSMVLNAYRAGQKLGAMRSSDVRSVRLAATEGGGVSE